MSILAKNKLSGDIRDKVIKQKERENTRGKDPRFLNYFDLDFGQEMMVVLLPDSNGELYTEYETHGDNLKARGSGKVVCPYKSSGEDCPICSKSYGHWTEGEKDEAAKWRSKTHFLGQVVVLDSPVEITEPVDGNLVKLFNMPFAIKEFIEESIINGTVPDPTEQALVIKKTKNAGGRAAYDKSYFKPGKAEEYFTEELIEAAEAGNIRQYDLSEEVPGATTTEEADKWLEKAMRLDQQMADKKSGNNSGGAGGASTGASSSGNTGNASGGNNDSASETKAEQSTGSSGGEDLAARLARLKQNQGN